MSTAQQAGPDAVPDAAPVPSAPAPPTAHTPTRRRKKGRPLPHLDRCLNCGRPTGEADNFCPNCGQENEDETVTLKPLVADALAEIASWDSKLFRTVLPLLFRPGLLTNEFLAGRRVRYLSPLKMYLVISAVFFLVLPTGSITQKMRVNPNGVSVTPGTPQGAKHQPTALTVSMPDDDGKKGSTTQVVNFGGLETLPATVAAYDAQQRAARHQDGFFKTLLVRQVIKARRDNQTFAQSVIQGVITDLPKMMFALLPLFALLLKVTYWRRRRLYIEHLIFALHSHAFTFTLLTLAVLVSTHWAAASDAVWGAFFVTLTVYLYAAMRRVYKQGWWKTGFKLLWLACNYIVLLSVAFALTAAAAFLFA